MGIESQPLSSTSAETLSAEVTSKETSLHASVQRALAGTGAPLDGSLKGEMEQRFGHDFSGVRIHTGSEAEQSARELRAHAYSLGSDVVFGAQRYTPHTSAGRHLLAHELAHVVQQSGASGGRAGEFSDIALEKEAHRSAMAITTGGQMPALSRGAGPRLSRFSDTGHHVIEEAALEGAGFSEPQIRAIERGNIHRDYSQIGAVGNALLLCDPHGFGGYAPEQHFDNFIFDAATDRWRTRGTARPFLHDDPNTPDRSPIDYIEDELGTLARAGMSEESLVHLGNAFHTVEDFFAHSNFVELINNERIFGTELVTGSFEGESANSTASLSHTLEGVSTPAMSSFYEQQGEAATAHTEPRSHSHIAKDTPGAHNYEQARRLAALVIQELGADVITVMHAPDPEQRVRLMNQTVLAKIRHYCRPPDPNDRWWEQLTTRDAGAIDRRLTEAAARTPITVNQCMFSPLRGLEASSSSTWSLPLGVALPVRVGNDRIWIQAGAGLTTPTTPLPLDRSIPAERSQFIVGAQITGRF